MGESFAWWAWVKMTTFNFMKSKIHFSVIWTPQTWKCVPAMMGYTGLAQNLTKILEREEGSVKMWEGATLRLILKY